MNGKKRRKPKGGLGKTRVTKEYPSSWELDPQLVLPPDLIPELEAGQKHTEVLEWLNKYGEMILKARGYFFLGLLVKWDLTKNNKIRYRIGYRYPRDASIRKISNILYPDDMKDLNAIPTLKGKLNYLAPLLEHIGIVFVEHGSDPEPNQETPNNGETK